MFQWIDDEERPRRELHGSRYGSTVYSLGPWCVVCDATCLFRRNSGHSQKSVASRRLSTRRSRDWRVCRSTNRIVNPFHRGLEIIAQDNFRLLVVLRLVKIYTFSFFRATTREAEATSNRNIGKHEENTTGLHLLDEGLSQKSLLRLDNYLICYFSMCWEFSIVA